MAEFDKAETVDDWQENVAEYVEESRDVNPTIRTKNRFNKRFT